MFCINIRLTINPFTFNTDCICKLLYMIVTRYKNKTLYNRVFFSTKFTVLMMFSCIHRAHPKSNNEN